MYRARNQFVAFLSVASIGLLLTRSAAPGRILPTANAYIAPISSPLPRPRAPRPAFVGTAAASVHPIQALKMGMAQPETQIKTKTTVETKEKQKVISKSKVRTGDPVEKRKEEFQDAPMFKLMLLADDGYDPEHVITRMCAVMEDLDEGQASTVFQQAMQTGKAMCGTYPFEIAELYKEQLIRSDPMIFADMQED